MTTNGVVREQAEMYVISCHASTNVSRLYLPSLVSLAVSSYLRVESPSIMATPPLTPSSPSRTVSDAKRAEALRALNRPRSRLRWFTEWGFILAVAMALVMFIMRPFVVEAFKIPSGSMERTLLVGDFLFVNKAVYGAEVPLVHVRLPAFQHPKRGEILVFDSAESEKNYVKRLVGLPGDTVEMTDASCA